MLQRSTLLGTTSSIICKQAILFFYLGNLLLDKLLLVRLDGDSGCWSSRGVRDE